VTATGPALQVIDGGKVDNEPPAPQDLEAEEKCLGALLIGGGMGEEPSRKIVQRVRDAGLEPEDFYYRTKHGAIFSAMLAADDEGKPVEASIVAHLLEGRGELELVGGKTKLVELWNLATAAGNAAHFANLVIAAARRRSQREVGKALAVAADNGGLDSDPALRRRLDALLQAQPGHTKFTLTVETAPELAALPEPDASDLLLGSLIVRGQRTLIAAGTGEGKTTFVFQAIRSIIEGEDFVGYQGRGGEVQRVLYIDAEQGLRTIKRRLVERGLDTCDRLDYIRVPDGLVLDSNQAHVAEVERVLRETPYSVVVADPLYKLHAGDSNAEREAVDLMRRFDRWRTEHHFALVMPAHTRKPVVGSKFTIHELFASSAYPRGAEVVLGLQRTRDGYAKLHYWKDRDGDLPIGARWGLLYSHDDGFCRDPKDEGPSTREQVAEIRARDPEITQKQAAKEIGVSERTVRHYWNEDTDASQTQLLDDAETEPA
jgi:hypothetical protein